VLTAKALDLLPVLIALGVWGNRWLAPEGELLTVVDAQSGDAMDVAVVDRRTSRPLRAGEVAITAGPGARRVIRDALKTPMVLGARARGVERPVSTDAASVKGAGRSGSRRSRRP